MFRRMENWAVKTSYLKLSAILVVWTIFVALLLASGGDFRIAGAALLFGWLGYVVLLRATARERSLDRMRTALWRDQAVASSQRHHDHLPSVLFAVLVLSMPARAWAFWEGNPPGFKRDALGIIAFYVAEVLLILAVYHGPFLLAWIQRRRDER
jgi:hypothetical protein